MQDDGIRSASPRELACVAFGFTLLTIGLTYPQILVLTSAAGPHYDSLFSIWRLAWIAHQLAADPLQLFHANIFHPEPDTLAYSDAILLLGALAAPLIWLGAHPVTVHNLLVLLSFVVSGVGMYAFVRGIGAAAPAAAVSAVSFAFQPYRFAHYSQLELLWAGGIPLALLALHRALARPTWTAGVWLGLCVALQALACLYYGVYLVAALAILAPVLAWGLELRTLRMLWRPAVTAAAAAGALLLPYALPYVRSQGDVGPRTIQDVAAWSPTALSYTIAQNGSWLYPGVPIGVDPFEGVLLPGATLVLCALVGLIAGPRRLAVAYALLALLAADLSLGVNGVSYRYLFDAVWPMQGLRVPARAFVIVSVALSTLAAFGAGTWTSGRRRLIAAGGLAALCLAETASTPLDLATVSRVPPKIYTWLAEQPPAPLLEWPVPKPDAIAFTDDARYMYFSIFHWQPLLNGYSGHHPDRYIRLLEQLRTFPDAGSREAIRRSGARYLILHSAPDLAGYVRALEALSGDPAFLRQSTDHLGQEELTLYTVEPLPGERSGAIPGR